jgi:hypothetical protein
MGETMIVNCGTCDKEYEVSKEEKFKDDSSWSGFCNDGPCYETWHKKECAAILAKVGEKKYDEILRNLAK